METTDRAFEAGEGFFIGRQDPSESNALAELIIRAFAADKTWGERRTVFEPYIPALLSSGAEAGRALSLVARAPDDRVLGHALWYPYKTRFGGVPIEAWCLAPIAVDPDVAGRGIGGSLMRASIDELKEQGAPMAFLLGHEGYYPRFGFRPKKTPG
jgi:predicted N-acetyltransferase YhbS